MQAQAQLDSLGMDTGNSVNMGGVNNIESLSVALKNANIGFDGNTASIKNMNQHLSDAGDTITTFTLRQKEATTDIETLPRGTYVVVTSAGNHKIIR